jgi:hypothetical protein
MFLRNAVFGYEETSYRILSSLSDEIVWIDIEDSSSFPSLIEKKVLTQAIENGILTKSEDPYAYLALLTPIPGSTECVKRDNNYRLIKELVDNSLYYDAKVRFSIIKKIVIEHKTTEQTLYRLARRYWQRGQTPNTLIPDYKNSGGRGKKRTKGSKKLGRPRKHMPGTGVVIDDRIERLFRVAINTYLLKDRGASFPYAHRRFKDMYELYYPSEAESEIPTNWQMLHFYKREYNQVERITKRTSAIQYNKDVRPLKSTANAGVLGPGSRYEIDATIADIYLVSDSDRQNIVGRPVIYIVIDVFSRMVAGFYIGFENPSYIAAMQALVMSMTDKVQICKDLGFDIESSHWPVAGLPDAILADRGELLGYQIESLEKSFSVRIENTPPYRGDAKAIVERSFRTLQAEFKPFAPGVVTGTTVKKRGGKDYRLDAALSVTDFKEIILSSILVHNQFDVMTKYDRDIDMPPDMIMTPLSIWNWGLQHRTGRLRAASESALRISLLPRVTAKISDLGVSAFGLFYTSPEIVKNGWLLRSSDVSRPKSLEAAYDPAVADQIYIFPNNRMSEYWVCNLTPKSREFIGCSFWDVWNIQDIQKKTQAKSLLDFDQKRREHERFLLAKIEAAKLPRGITHSKTKSERLASIGKNKTRERDRERKSQNNRADDNATPLPNNVIHLNNDEETDLGFPDHLDNLFDSDEEDS